MQCKVATNEVNKVLGDGLLSIKAPGDFVSPHQSPQVFYFLIKLSGWINVGGLIDSRRIQKSSILNCVL